MVKKTIKQMLVDLYKDEREQMRCTVVHELKEEAKGVTKPYMDQIDEWESDISTLNRQIAEVRDKIRKHVSERDERLKEKKLHTFTHQTCGDALHSRLTEFDKITNNHIREILENTGKKQ
jgi:uncharacterized coiled-coil DUF342 family protein